MSWMKNLKIWAQLALGFAAMGLLIAVLGGVAVSRMSAIATQFDLVQDDRLPKIKLANDIKDDVNHVARALPFFEARFAGLPQLSNCWAI